MLFLAVLTGFLFTGFQSTAVAQVPSRQIPPSVLVELRLLENRFDLALASDCDAERCFSKGCSYVDHAVADQPRSGSLPGLGQDPGPGGVASQEYLTRARCSFAHEKALESSDVQALVRRLQAKLSTGWTVVSVDHSALQPLAPYMREAPEPEPAEAEAEPVEEEPAPILQAEEWTAAAAGRELWTTLLPHFFWMIGLFMVTLAGALLIWSWRRVGRASIEEQALLAQLALGDPDPDPDDPSTEVVVEESDQNFVEEQEAAWTARLESEDPDPELQALIRELLRSGDIPLLAKAVLRFPDTLPAAFPSGGDIAAAKIELAEFLKTVDADTLPSDVDFFESLSRHALAAALVSQSDADVVRSLREDFGAAGLVDLMGRLPPRVSALLFALAPLLEQHEMARLLSPRQAAVMSQQLLRSNRMDKSETAFLFEVLRAARADEPLPAAPPASEVSDRGATFDAAGALSVLLPVVNPEQRAALFGQSLQRFNGSFPAWYRGILLSDMLLELSAEARADLLLEIDVDALAAWLSLLDADTTAQLLDGLPERVRALVGASSVFPSRARQLADAEQGRRDLARGFQRQLARTNMRFEQMLGVGPDTTRDP